MDKEQQRGSSSAGGDAPSGQNSSSCPKVTSKDVARLAGVSQSTVSRVFNRSWKGLVKEDARARVLKAAEELHYFPNTIARILSSKHSCIVGIIISRTFDLFYYQVAGVLVDLLNQQGYQAMLFTADPQDSISTLLTDIVRYQVDGIIITSSAVTHDLRQMDSHLSVPTVLFNGYLPHLQLSAVYSDNYSACQAMADYLVRVGHQRFAYISTGNSKYGSYLPRQEAFLSGLSRNGIHQCQVENAGYSYESGREAAQRLLSPSDYPDAIFCAGDLSALGFIDTAREMGLRVGEDISITGFDAPCSVRLPAYGLTVLHQNIHTLAADAIHLLLELIDHPDTPQKLITRPMELLLGSSSRDPSDPRWSAKP